MYATAAGSDGIDIQLHHLATGEELRQHFLVRDVGCSVAKLRRDDPAVHDLDLRLSFDA